jgi:hypothetical protein
MRNPPMVVSSTTNLHLLGLLLLLNEALAASVQHHEAGVLLVQFLTKIELS